jgi:hypothetical protein
MTDLELKEQRADSILRKAYRAGEVIVGRTKLGNLRVDHRWQTYAVISCATGGVLRAGNRSHVKKFLVNSCLEVVRIESNEPIKTRAEAVIEKEKAR